MKKPYSESRFWHGIIAIGLDVYVSNWNQNETGRDQVKQFIINTDCAKNILNLIYGRFVSCGKILSIESMPVELLSDLESEALSWQPVATGKQLTRLMKAIWAMNYLITADAHDGPEFPVMTD